MKLRKNGAEIFVPDGLPVREAIQRTTYMGIGAHQDDLEIMAYDGILKSFGNNQDWFLGVVATNGSGSPRDDLYADYTDEQMQRVRAQEQKKAAFVGEYGSAVLLTYTSSEIKDVKDKNVIEDLKSLIKASRPKVIYTHNLADKHDTHVALSIRVIQALRELPKDNHPDKLYGCEVWRGLDWLIDEGDKIIFDVSAHPNIGSALVEVFDSQICGGKRYDLATAGRRLANATYAASHGTDEVTASIYAMDLTPLIVDRDLDITEYIRGYIRRFNDDVSGRISRVI